MASGLSSPLGISGIIFIIIGIIMTVAGVILLISNQTTSTPWYIWLVLVGGILIGIIGGIMLAVALSRVEPTLTALPTIVPYTTPAPVAAPAPVITPTPAPVITPLAAPPAYTPPTPMLQPSYVPQPQYQPPMNYLPQSPQANITPQVNTMVRPLGPPQYDPDPTYSVTNRPGSQQRISGMYEVNGVRMPTTGVLTTPPEQVITAVDYPNSQVRIGSAQEVRFG